MRRTPNLLTAFTAASCLMAGFSATAAKAMDEDFNVWTAQVVTIEADKDFRIRLEAQERFTDDASRLGQLLLRPAIGYQVNEDVSVYAGYAYVLTDPEGPAKSNEHRFFQEVNLRQNLSNTVSISSRNRFEQRTWEETGGTALRYRNQVAVRAKVSETNNLIVYTEPFIPLNSAGFQSDEVVVWRNFVGVSVPISKQFSLTPGYLNQHTFRPAEDRTQHIANVTLGARF